MFEAFDFSLLNEDEIKEDGVREELINPLLKKLGYKAYGDYRIIYSKTLKHPIIKVGSGSREVKSVPDYLLSVKGKYAWVLDAKAPNENIHSGENVEQVYFYAIHPEVRVNLYVLCNGKELVIFNISKGTPILSCQLCEVEHYWSKIEELLSPNAFTNKILLSDTSCGVASSEGSFDYSSRPILSEIPVKKQQAKRHFGVHGYFTRQSWNVVQEYIKNFTKPGDTVLDPFGGSGVTVAEALILGRKGVHIDINPLSIFLTNTLLKPTNIEGLYNQFQVLKNKFLKNHPKTEKQINYALRHFAYPNKITLPKDSDVEFVYELFTPHQLANLAFLRHLILGIKDDDIMDCLLLAFSSTLTKINRTYHPSKTRGDGGGNCAAFCYYRYRIAPETVELDILKCFETKISRLIAAKNELSPFSSKYYDNIKVLKGSADSLPLKNESIDYIYTDPPYGSKIPYLDLSTMWNAWLDLEVTNEDYKQEAIEGGRLEKTTDDYALLIKKSINEMYRVLKFNRWMSFVFAHQDPKYWHLIVESAEKAGFEYAGAVKQTNGQQSFKKRQNPFSVLSGQLIINFRKVKNPETIQRIDLGVDIFDIVIETIESVIAKDDGASIEQINDELILKGLELGFLDVLSKKYKDLTPILKTHFDYDNVTEKFHIKKNKQFKTHIPVYLRIRYFLISYLKRQRALNINPSTDQIILDIMPLLKNGTTPENQTILNVLETVADKVEHDNWRLKETSQLRIFEL